MWFTSILEFLSFTRFFFKYVLETLNLRLTNKIHPSIPRQFYLKWVLSHGLLPVEHALLRKASRSIQRGILIKSPNHLSKGLSMERSSSSNPSLPGRGSYFAVKMLNKWRYIFRNSSKTTKKVSVVQRSWFTNWDVNYWQRKLVVAWAPLTEMRTAQSKGLFSLPKHFYTTKNVRRERVQNSSDSNYESPCSSFIFLFFRESSIMVND